MLPLNIKLLVSFWLSDPLIQVIKYSTIKYQLTSSNSGTSLLTKYHTVKTSTDTNKNDGASITEVIFQNCCQRAGICSSRYVYYINLQRWQRAIDNQHVDAASYETNGGNTYQVCFFSFLHHSSFLFHSLTWRKKKKDE